MKTSDFIKQIENGNAKVLTVEAARNLKGKKIIYAYFGYNPAQVEEMVVGNIVTEYDFYKTQPCPGYDSRTAYWESYMPEEKLQDTKETLLLLDENGAYDPHYIKAHLGKYNFYNEPTFTCSDADREVYYIECDEDENN